MAVRIRIKLLLSLIISILGAGIFGMVIYQQFPHKMIVGLYDIPQPTAEAIQQIVEQYYPDFEKSFEWQNISNKIPISRYLDQNPRTAFIIAADQKALAAVYPRCLSYDIEQFNMLPSTFLNNFFIGKTPSLYGFPLLADPLHCMYNKALCTALQFSPADSLEELEAILQQLQAHCDIPIVCAGGNDTILLSIVSAMAAMQGINMPEALFEHLPPSFNLKTDMPPQLHRVLEKLALWRKKGWLHPEWFRLVEKDIDIFMEYENAGMVFLPFSHRRSVKPTAIEKYRIARIPLPAELKDRRIPANIITAVRIADSKTNKQADSLQSLLLSYEVNEDLSKTAQLVPVFSNTQTDNVETSFARYWIAVVNTVLPDIGNIVCMNADEKAQLASAFRQYFEVNGVGY